MGPIGCLVTMISIGASLFMGAMMLWFFTYNNPALGFLIFILFVVFGIVVAKKAVDDLRSGKLRPEDYFSDDW